MFKNIINDFILSIYIYIVNTGVTLTYTFIYVYVYVTLYIVLNYIGFIMYT